VLPRQVVCCLSHTSSRFFSGHLWDRVSLLPRLAWTGFLLFYASYCYWDDRCDLPHSAFFLLKWGLTNFSAWAGLELQSSQSQLPM
jgi:hypothetical protein